MADGGRSRAILVVAIVALAAAACGGSRVKTTAPDTTPTSSATDSPSTSAAHAAKTSPKKTAKKAAAKHATGTTVTTVGGHTRGVPSIGAASPSSGATVTVPITTAGAPAPTVGNTTPATSVAAPTPTTVKPFDPTQTIDLSGTPGETPAQQHAAEQLVRDTLKYLPRYGSQQAAYAAGYRSIGDALTGDEHYVNWSYVNDGHILDARYPESLVYEFPNGAPKLVAAMYMLPDGSRFTDIPALYDGPLTQWHQHINLCFGNTSDPLQKVVVGTTNGDGLCPAGETRGGTQPMIHVWIVANPCGPFAALNGIGAGQVPDGQTRNCDTAHSGTL